MAELARSSQDPSEPSSLPLAPPAGLRRVAPALPVHLHAQQLGASGDALAAPLRYVDGPHGQSDKKNARKEAGVLRGIKDLQQLQKQTILVLEAVKANLEDISQVLRSPEATRGLEKQQNAATLLSKGFARDAVEQAMGAVALLPANPEAHLLLSLSLAADQQFENSLAAARKGLALFDRRAHALAIEAGLLHALAALGCGGEAAERWATIIEGLPIPVLLEHLGRIAACFPADAPEGQLDELVTRRLMREAEALGRVDRRPERRARSETVETRPGDIPAGILFAGLDAAHDAKLSHAHRAILGQIGRRLNDAKDSTAILRFLTECVIPLGNMGLTRSTNALGRASVKRLLRVRADAMMLFRAMEKLEMAGAATPARELAKLLDHWRRAGAKRARAGRMLWLSAGLMAAGAAVLAYVLGPLGVLAGKTVVMGVGPWHLDAIWAGPACIGAGALVGLWALMGRTWTVALPEDRPGLSAEELRFVRSGAVKHAIRGVLGARRKSADHRAR